MSPYSPDEDPIGAILADWERERPDIDPFPMAIFGRLARVSKLATGRLSSLLRQHDLSRGSFDVLANLRRAGEPYRRTPSELAQSAMLTTGGMTGRLDRLQSLGLISRKMGENDRRVMYAQLTPEGLRLIDSLIEAHLDQEDEMLAALSQDEQRQISELLARLEYSVLSSEPSA